MNEIMKINEYFNGNVTSIALESAEGKATVGVIAKGEYEFVTATVEIMTVVCGKLEVQLANQLNWITYKKHESFSVPKDSKFKVRAAEDTPYLCLYK
jgi:purine/pyrimidine-nucleoside phosphorylase